MSARSGKRRGHEEAHADERWLLTYSDMITLLMALFIVMWAISSVNISKFDQLKVSLKSAFSGKVLPSSSSILQGESAPMEHAGTPVTPPTPSTVTPALKANISAAIQRAAARQDVENLRRVEARIHVYARTHGLAAVVQTRLDERGLVVRLLTDRVLFATGEAVLRPGAVPLLDDISRLLAAPDIPNPVRVEGNTDSLPIHSAAYPSNWELSTARATAVLQFLLAHDVAPRRLSATGYGSQNPLASNETAAGRAANRRVELVILRRSFTPTPEAP